MSDYEEEAQAQIDAESEAEQAYYDSKEAENHARDLEELDGEQMDYDVDWRERVEQEAAIAEMIITDQGPEEAKLEIQKLALKLKGRRFLLVRDHDVSGVSGTGIVAMGMEFPTGRAAMHWLVAGHTTTIYDSMTILIDIHGHDGMTKVHWLDSNVLVMPKDQKIDIIQPTEDE